jgi:hypothetical protein
MSAVLTEELKLNLRIFFIFIFSSSFFQKYMFHLKIFKTISLPSCGTTFGPKRHTTRRLQALQYPHLVLFTNVV